MTTKILGNQITSFTIDTEQLSNTATAAFAKTLAPKILYANVASNTYSLLDDTAVNVGGGFIVVTGSEFQSGAQVLIDTVAASSVTYVDSNTLRAQVPAKTAASYNLYVVNPDGGVGLKVAGITYSGTPTWVTASQLANVTSNTVFSNTFFAIDAVSYANTTILPTGFNLLANGYYFGNISVGLLTTYSFDIRATDAENQDSDKTFSLTATKNQPPYSVDYLVVAGGGAGGFGGYSASGGGGAGGLTSGSLTLDGGSVYTITVGAGGAGAGATGGSTPSTYTALRGATGANSSIAGSEISTVLARGGGGGGVYQFANPAPVQTVNGAGGTGGSGGGSAYQGTSGTAIGSPGPGSPGTQGFPGGSGAGGSGGGGGGGAGGSGGNPGTPNPNAAGRGGNGLSSSITGSAVTYAGGGGGGGPSNSGAAGPGGGGLGGGSGAQGNPGTTNTGGGGGGSGPNQANPGASGGSGVVILSMPTFNYPGSAPGATVTTPPAAPGKTIITFNSSGTYTA
jgi:hypothetical protein